MLLYEIDKTDLKKYGNVKKVIQLGKYIIRDETFIKGAFNFGNGTSEDMNRYMKDNSRFCVWFDAETMQKVNRI